MKNLLIISLILTFSNYSKAQENNEQLIYSFKTEEGKLTEITLDTVSNKLIFRFGKSDKTDLEIADNLDDTIVVFKYSYYLRGGGAENAGLDLNYLTFSNDKHSYEIFDEYSAEDNMEYIGIRIMDTTYENVNEIRGIPESREGVLMDFRYNGLIPIDQ